jgi:predicted secreted protein
MFDDKRGKKIVILAHCLLNQNSISDGTSDFPAQFREVIDVIMENRIGILQLPCPELTCLGLDRGDEKGGSRELLRENSRIRGLMETSGPVERLREMARLIAGEIEEYRNYGFKIAGLIGIDRSPSCGVGTTSKGDREVPGSGVFMDILIREIAARGIEIDAIGVKTSRVAESTVAVKTLLKACPG